MPPLLRDLFDHSARGLQFNLTSVEDDEDLGDAVRRLQPDYLVVGLQNGWPAPRVLTAFAARPAVRVLGVSQRNGLVYVYSLDRGELGELDSPLLAKEMRSRAG
jgi:hypothetical protein